MSGKLGIFFKPIVYELEGVLVAEYHNTGISMHSHPRASYIDAFDNVYTSNAHGTL